MSFVMVMQDIADLKASLQLVTTRSTHCITPGCGNELFSRPIPDQQLIVCIDKDIISSLQQAIAAEFAAEEVKDWACQDVDDCQECQVHKKDASRKCSKHCWRQGASRELLLMNQGFQLVIQLKRFQVIPDLR